jgi:hypothetical protein
MVGSFDPESERISLTLGTDRSIDETRWYSDTLQEIRRSFPESPYITMLVGIVIRKIANLDDIYHDPNGSENDLDLTDMLQHS